VRIRKYLEEGYTADRICAMLHTTHNRIRRYATGDPDKLCRFNRGTRKRLNYDKYREEIIGYLRENMSYTAICAQIMSEGYNGKIDQLRKYCQKLIVELCIEHNSRKNPAGVYIKKGQESKVHYVTSKEIFRYLWSGVEIGESDKNYIFQKYPELEEMQLAIMEFRAIYAEKDGAKMERYIERYKESTVEAMKSFASGLLLDKEAVKNSVVSELSNGFVEGINTKIKLIKRVMYGRAKLDLLSAKIIHAY